MIRIPSISGRFPRAWAWFWAAEPMLSAAAWLLLLLGIIRWIAGFHYYVAFLLAGESTHAARLAGCILLRPRILWHSRRR